MNKNGYEKLVILFKFHKQEFCFSDYSYCQPVYSSAAAEVPVFSAAEAAGIAVVVVVCWAALARAETPLTAPLYLRVPS